MSDIPAVPFNREYEFEYARVESIAPGLRRVVARNPSAFTFYGTGTYIVGTDQVAVIDPGPAMPEHIDAVLAAVKDSDVSHLLITHTHLDHSPASNAVQADTGAKTYGYGPHGSGKIDGDIQIEEGADVDFVPDVIVRDGDVIEGDGWSFECAHTPGHTSNHVCFQWREQRALFSGDHVMGWNTTIVSPPDGDMADYITSLDKLLARDDRIYYPTHGSPITKPKLYVEKLRAHRLYRAEQILECLKAGDAGAMSIVKRLYTHLPDQMHGAAAQAVLSTLIYLQQLGSVSTNGAATLAAVWRVAQN